MATKKIKKISINELERCVLTEPNERYIDWKGNQILVKNHLSLTEMANFVDNVVKSCFSDDGEYYPEIRDFAFKAALLEFYSNFALPQNPEKRYELVILCDASDLIYKEINRQQLDSIIYSIDEKIEYIKRSNIEAVNKQISEVFTIVDTLQNQFESLFNGINNNDLTQIAQSLNNGKIDEEKLMNAYMGIKNEQKEIGEN